MINTILCSYERDGRAMKRPLSSAYVANTSIASCGMGCCAKKDMSLYFLICAFVQRFAGFGAGVVVDDDDDDAVFIVVPVVEFVVIDDDDVEEEDDDCCVEVEELSLLLLLVLLLLLSLF